MSYYTRYRNKETRGQLQNRIDAANGKFDSAFTPVPLRKMRPDPEPAKQRFDCRIPVIPSPEPQAAPALRTMVVARKGDVKDLA